MKRALFIITLFLITSTVEAESIKSDANSFSTDTLPTEELTTFLKDLDLASYYGKPVDTLMAAIPANFYNLKVYGGGISKSTIFYASEMPVYFTPLTTSGPSMVVYVREFTHLTRYSSTRTWDVNLFRKEKIFKVSIYDSRGQCINGNCMD